MFPDGQERPIAFTSRTLIATERNYLQIEKEALSRVYGIRKFHQYHLYSCRFMLVTDHKPLTTVLGPQNGIPPLAAARLQRWALMLSGYSYDIEFKPTRQHGNADGLSRLPLGHRHNSRNRVPFYDGRRCFRHRSDACLASDRRLQTATRQDPLKVLLLVYPGVTEMNSVARSYMWWPGLEKKSGRVYLGLSSMSGLQECSCRSTTASVGVASKAVAEDTR